MKKSTFISLFSAVLVSLFAGGITDAAAHEIGIGYGAQLRNNTDIYQLEFFYRPALPFLQKRLSSWRTGTRAELAAAHLALKDNSDFSTMRFSVMPQIYAQTGNFLLFAGFGTGFMSGDTEYPSHDLGGEFLLNSKLGVELLVHKNIGLEASFYHQSNAGTYDHNASLNMLVGNVVFRF